jgi:hypothetical protein
MKHSGKTENRRGRPATGRDPSVTFRLPAELLEWIDEEARTREIGRSEMLLRLIEESRLGVPQGLSRIRTAYHEAGHAVISRAFGVSVVRATIIREGSSLGHILNGSDVHSANGLAHVMILMAGREAEQMVLGFHHDTRGDRSDRRKIMSALRHIWSSDRDKLIKEMRIRTGRLVMRKFRQSIINVAQALLSAETLDQKRLDQIIKKTGEKIDDAAEWCAYRQVMLVRKPREKAAP